MKKTVWIQGMLLAAVMSSALQAMAQTKPAMKDDLFEGTQIFEKNASNVTEITMDPNTLGMVGGHAHNMLLNVVRTYEYDQPGMYKIEDVDVFRKKVSTGDWFCSVHSRDLKHNESTDICNKRRTDDIEEKAIISVEPKELTFIHTIRKRNPGEDGGYGELMSFPGSYSLAMLNPELMELKMHLPGMHLPDLSDMNLNVNVDRNEINAIKAMPKIKIDNVKIESDMKEADKQLKEAQKQFDKLQKQDAPGPPDATIMPDDQKSK